MSGPARTKSAVYGGGHAARTFLKMVRCGVFSEPYIVKYLVHFCLQQILTIQYTLVTHVSLMLLFVGQITELIKKNQ